MKIETAWVSPPLSIGGLDHLGTQAPCILIYGQLLPGITNVTDRARYYSFYPWLVWSFDQRYAKDDEARFIELFRRADCLFTLIAERHSRMTDHDNEKHGNAMVGRDQLVQALNRLEAGEALKLSQYTAQDSPQRYFKSRMGGLTQYYAGTLSGLDLMDASAKPWIKYTADYGSPLAKNVDIAIKGYLFWKVIEKDNVTLNDLDLLNAFCACQLTSSVEECKTLTDIYFDRNNIYAEEGAQRRNSLALILQLVHALPDDFDLSEGLFRACVYSGTLPNRQNWLVPEVLHPTMAHWATYVRNDLLSIACQTILALSLRELQPQGNSEILSIHSVESFAKTFAKNPVLTGIPNDLHSTTFNNLLDRMKIAAPSIDAWEDDNHEIQLVVKMKRAWSDNESSADLVQMALALLAMLAIRDDLKIPAYDSLAILPEALEDYPINLVSFRERVTTWRPMTIEEVVADLITWCLNTHLRVALRKLRQTGRSTFHLRPSERGLEVVGVDIPPPTHTTPRFRQAVQILRDIGALERDSSTQNWQTVLSDVGLKLMEEANV